MLISWWSIESFTCKILRKAGYKTKIRHALKEYNFYWGVGGEGARTSTQNKLQYNAISSLKEVKRTCFGSTEERESSILPGWAREKHRRSPLALLIFATLLQGKYFKWQLALRVRVETGPRNEEKMERHVARWSVGTKLWTALYAPQGK